MLTINTNVASLQAQKNLAGAQFNLTKAIDHLSSGLRITSAADDATGLKQAMTGMGEIASLNADARSVQKALTQTQTAEGYLNEVTNIYVRLKEIDDTSAEATALKARLTDIDTAGSINGVDVTLSDGSEIKNAKADSTVSGKDLDTIAGYREDFGATANALQGALGSVQTAIANKSAEVSAIQDVDVAEETSKLSRFQVLAQAGVAVLAQANQLPQMALKLLG